MLNVGLAAAILYALSGASVEGTVQSGEFGEPLAGVRVEAVDCPCVTWTDSAGHYLLGNLASGAHRLRVSRLGYDARSVDVVVAHDGVLRVDFVLTVRPVSLTRVQITDRWRFTSEELPPPERGNDSVRESWRMTGARLRTDPAVGDADALQALSILPEAATLPELPTALHVRGGSGDQNLILLDGVPLYNPYHAAGMLTAINPDVISAISLRSDVGSVRDGGALSSVVGLETVRPASDGRTAWHGRLNARAVGQTVTGALPAGAGGYALSGRRSTGQLLPGLADQGSGAASFTDMFAKSTVRFRQGELDVFSLTSTDRVAFDARVGAAGTEGASAAGDGAASPLGPGIESPQNNFAWRTGTQAIVWRGRHDALTPLTVRAWHTQFAATADWEATTGAVQLTSTLRHDGVAGETSRRFSSSVVSVGVSGEQVHTEYDVRHNGAHDATIALLPTLGTSRVTLSAFVEDEWRVTPRWTLAVGVREQLGAGQWGHVSPRTSVRYDLAPRIALTAGYARTYQNLQSLRNEESIVDAVVGTALPLLAETGGAPVASSDIVTLTADVHLGAPATLRVAAYGRRLDDLLLVAPTTAQPFAMTGFSRGSGHASGLTVFLDWRTPRLSGHAGYSVGTTSRETVGQRYRPSFAASQGFNAAIGYHPRASTAVRAALWSTTGRPTSLVDGELQWAPHTVLGGREDMAGTPERIVGALNAERLPRYARLDLGIRQEWRLGFGSRAMDVTGVLNLANALNRANVLGRSVSPGSLTRRDIALVPRSLSVGLEWSY